MKGRELFRLMKANTGWLYAAEFIPRVGALFVVPIWSARVAPAEYAHWILALTSVELARQISNFGMGGFLAKVVYRFHDDRAEKYFGLGATVVLAVSLVCAVVMAVFSPWLSETVIGAGVRKDLFSFLGLYLFFVQFNNLAVQYLSNGILYRSYFILMMSRWTLNTAFLLYFLLVRDQGFYSWVWAALLSETLLLPLAAAFLRRVRWGWFRKRMFRFAVRFGSPGLATSFLAWGQSRIGRYVLAFSGLGTGVGLYGVAQNFALNYGAAVRPTKIVAADVLGHALEGDEHSPYYLEFFHGFSCLALVAAFVVALFLGDFMKLIVAPGYYGATVALPPLVYMMYLNEIYSMYGSLMFRYFKVWFNFWGSVIGFLVVTVCTLLLVRPFGFVGAAVAQLAGSGALVFFAHKYAVRVSPRPFRIVEKTLFTVAAFLLTFLPELLAFSVFAKMLLAALVLTPYVIFHWRRRYSLFPLAAGAIEMLRPAGTGTAS